MKNRISTFLESRIEAKTFPSAVYLIAEKGEIVLQEALGFAVVEPEKIEAKIDTIYDLASLTKPLVTGLLCAKLIESEELKLSDKVAKFFSEFDTREKRGISIENLLTHNSGFKGWLPFYSDFNFLTGEFTEVIRRIENEGLINRPNSKVVYSDLNFILLGFLLENIFGGFEIHLNSIARKEILEPLKLKKTFFNPSKDLQKQVAASEKGNEYEKQMCIELGYEIDFPYFPFTPFRNYQVWGEVHDNNCYFMNGVAGHAGLFSTAEETFKIAQQFLPNQTTLLKPETCKLFSTNFTRGLNEARSIAFQLAETKDSTASKSLSKDSFGHLGFTGTSVWIEPETERIFTLLTNRTHARELPFQNINSVRRRFHELATEYLKSRS